MCRSLDLLLKRKTLWAFFLAAALVFSQGALLHVHVYNHDPDTSEHAHEELPHFNYDATEIGHHDDVAEISLSQQEFLKNPSFGSFVIALFAAVMVFLLPRVLAREPWRYDHRVILASWPTSLRPPPRAPPL